MTPDTMTGPAGVGDYELVYKIAEGGMGAVYKGRHRLTGKVVAVKILPAETARNPLLLKRFEQEFRAASLIDHPNVVKALDYCGTPPSPFLVMEFVDGESLGRQVERDGPVPEAEAVRLIGQVCEGLHRAHKRGLVHRDVKPDNILVTRDGVAKLTDLGLVKDVEGEQNLTRTGRGLGTPHFMAPEQFRDAKNADVRCDVYSLGATLYALLTGDVPFSNTSPLDCWLRKTKNELPEARAVNPGVGERVSWAVARAMQADPAARPASCREFMEDLTGAGWMDRAGPGSGALGVAPPPADLWYMVYTDAGGHRRTVKGATASIRLNVRSGALGDPLGILLSRSKAGPFLPLRAVPEYRDLLATASLSGGFPMVTPGVAAGDTMIDPDYSVPALPEAARRSVAAGPPAPAARPGRADLLPWLLVAAAGAAAGVGGLLFFR